MRELRALIDAVAQYQQEPAKYRGLQAHAKKVLERVVALAAGDIGELDLFNLTDGMYVYCLFKPLQTLADIGVRRFPTNAYFHFFAAEAMLSRNSAR